MLDYNCKKYLRFLKDFAVLYLASLPIVDRWQ